MANTQQTINEQEYKILTHQGFKTLNQSQYDLHEKILDAYFAKEKNDALKFLLHWEENYPELPSHLFFYTKDIKNKNYIHWYDREKHLP